MAARLIDFRDVCMGMRARVRFFSSDTHAAQRLQDLGLTVGTDFVVTKVAPFGDPVEIGFRGSRLCLRKSETEGLIVEQLE